MTKRNRLAAASAALLIVSAGPPAPGERVVTGDGVVAAQVNGVPARMRIDPGALAMPFVDADLAGRAKLREGSPLLGRHFGFGYAFRVGSTRISGRRRWAS